MLHLHLNRTTLRSWFYLSGNISDLLVPFLTVFTSSLFCFLISLSLRVLQVFYVSDLFKPRVKPATPPPSPIKKELLPSGDIIERNNHHNMV